MAVVAGLLLGSQVALVEQSSNLGHAVHFGGMLGLQVANGRAPSQGGTEGDRLGNIAQIADLQGLGWNGPVSFEAFAPQVHGFADPKAQLAASMQFIRDGLARKAA